MCKSCLIYFVLLVSVDSDFFFLISFSKSEAIIPLTIAPSPSFFPFILELLIRNVSCLYSFILIVSLLLVPIGLLLLWTPAQLLIYAMKWNTALFLLC